MTELEESLLEEIDFWEQFINEWNTEDKGPLPIKARDSLTYAQHKMDQYLTAIDESVGTIRQPSIMQKISKRYHSASTWVQLNTQIRSCDLCEGLNCEGAGTLNAPGYGNTQSKVVLIGQSLCGKPCMEAQIPFTGGSGKLLDKALQQAGVHKKDIYITNVVKCHPPKNRKSHHHEIENCTPYLNRELQWIEPSQIVCLGKDAWRYFNKSTGSPCKRDVRLNGNITTIHFLYHPSYIRQKSKEEQENYISTIAAIVKSHSLLPDILSS